MDKKKPPPRCENCELGHDIVLRDKDFGFGYASYQECKICGWQHWCNWAANRASGAYSWIAPQDKQEDV